MPRHPENPLITPADVAPFRKEYDVIGVLNAGAIEVEGKTLLLLRVAEKPVSDDIVAPIYDPATDTVIYKIFSSTVDTSDPRIIRDGDDYYLTSLSHLRRAWSDDGIHFTVEETPALFPANIYEEWGVEDPRITLIGATYYINYTGVSRYGAGTALATSSDMQSFERKGLIFSPDNRDVAIFPRKIGSKYYALHRPGPGLLSKPSIWLASSDNLLDWGDHKCIMIPRKGLWDGEKIGGGAVPIETEKGWLIIYHGVNIEGAYALGMALLALDDPTRIIHRSEEPLIAPEAEYETRGFFGNVAFTDGAILRDDDTLDIYYGASDETICLFRAPIDELMQ